MGMAMRAHDNNKPNIQLASVHACVSNGNVLQIVECETHPVVVGEWTTWLLAHLLI